jgi:hypothetical protein
MKDPNEQPDNIEESLCPLPVEVTLTGDQVAVCRMALIHRLAEVSGKLSDWVADDGGKLLIKKQLMRESAKLQLVLLHFGYTLGELENFVKNAAERTVHGP